MAFARNVLSIAQQIGIRLVIPTVICLLSSCTVVNTATPLPKQTPTPIPSFTSTPGSLPASSSSATKAAVENQDDSVLISLVEAHPASEVVVPILLYHHIAAQGSDQRYFVTPTQFAEQMQWLVDHGYEAITEAQLAEVIGNGGVLPEKPVIITFDDGNADFFKGAYPVMSRLKLVGVAFLITDRIDQPGSINSDQVRELINAGWEIGSHTASHPDLLDQRTNPSQEIGGSREWLNRQFGINVVSFAYPYGLMDDSIAKMVRENGYTSAARLGGRIRQSQDDLYFLGRTEIRGDYTMAEFVELMPWK